MRRTRVFVLIAATAGVCLAAASAAPAAITQRVIGPPTPSPVAFAKIESGGGPSVALAKGTPLRSTQRIIVMTMTGSDRPPNTCGGCFAQGWNTPTGFGLASAYVRARTPSGRVLALAPASGMLIASSGPDDAAVSFNWPRRTKRFAPGTRVVAYGLFVQGVSGGP
jgi:hypothetical protein